MEKIKDKIYEFMYGRYGYDELGKVLCGLMLGFAIANLFVKSTIINVIVWALFIYNLYRAFSKNIVARRLENDKFLRLIKPYQLQWTYRKTHKVFRCKNCGQIIRVPKGKGKIDVTCPKCRTIISKRT